MTPKAHELSEKKKDVHRKRSAKTSARWLDSTNDSNLHGRIFSLKIGWSWGGIYQNSNQHETEGERSHGFRPSMFL